MWAPDVRTHITSRTHHVTSRATRTHTHAMICYVLRVLRAVRAMAWRGVRVMAERDAEGRTPALLRAARAHVRFACLRTSRLRTLRTWL